MTVDPWTKYKEARDEALRVYNDATGEARAAYREIEKEASKVHVATLNKIRFEFKEASL